MKKHRSIDDTYYITEAELRAAFNIPESAEIVAISEDPDANDMSITIDTRETV